MSDPPKTPRKPLEPGWYHVPVGTSREETADYAAFSRLNRKTFRPGLVYTTDKKGPFCIVVFEVVDEPLVWTLPWFPTKAPNGLKTKLSEIMNAPDAPPDFLDQVDQWLRKPGNYVVEQVTSAGTVLLWGTVAVLLVGLWSTTKPNS